MIAEALYPPHWPTLGSYYRSMAAVCRARSLPAEAQLFLDKSVAQRHVCRGKTCGRDCCGRLMDREMVCSRYGMSPGSHLGSFGRWAGFQSPGTARSWHPLTLNTYPRALAWHMAFWRLLGARLSCIAAWHASGRTGKPATRCVAKWLQPSCMLGRGPQ